MKNDSVADSACPRCSCFVIRVFDCFCGQVHDHYCVNCCRWRSLPVDQHVELGIFDAICNVGPVPHDHPFHEREERMALVYAKMRNTSK